ncbi:Rgg/GadR/MutR family transcriptional regulator [Trichococcus shcherbakoviae]|uniref:HTH cro/C1-type domain-containing protein n=1 Tax=Trichococcus shcherbakoviae TaxID=2094020 RepID=A0A383TAL3_9LACT|nr:Rgg/GadR/MutR family transcriptional regulator [Trichococcus shcherbakoviae]SYZ77313.1 Hypothetical protein TART1_0081 [Trichococcus shcherbakoviae]
METGKLIRAIRKNKNLKSKDVYKNILTRPAISRFESGKSDTTAEKLFQILRNMNITLEEFYFQYNGNAENDDFLTIDAYTEAYYAKDLSKLADLEREAKIRYEETANIKFLHYAATIHLFQRKLTYQPISGEQFSIIRNYLVACETWGYYEVVLFTNSLDFFSADLIDALYPTVKLKMTEFNRIRRYKNELFSLVSNILVLYLEKNDADKSAYYYAELESAVSNSDNRMYEHAILLFFKELIALIRDKKEDTHKLQQMLQMFDFLEMKRISKQCSSLLADVRRNNAEAF